MKKREIKNLKLGKKTISSFNSRVLKNGINHDGVKGGCTQFPCTDDIGRPSLHCGSLSCESFACPTEEWTNGDCGVLFL